MSGFDLAELLPFYLDETDEHITALNDALLRLEQDPSDAKALQEAFRMFHSIKGASIVMGFQPVNQLTHHLESLFDQLRSRKRELDRPTLDLTFRCLDELRDYHHNLRAEKPTVSDLSDLVAQVVAYLHATAIDRKVSGQGMPPSQALSIQQPTQELKTTLLPTPVVPPVVSTITSPEELPIKTSSFDEPGGMTLTVVFQPKLPLADMKARLVLNRLSTKARILTTDPPVERLDETEPLPKFTIFLTTECNADELRSLADVEGVAEVCIEPLSTTTQAPADSYRATSPQADTNFTPSVQLAPTTATLRSDQVTTPIGEIADRVAYNPKAGGQSNQLTQATTSKQATGSAKAKIAETIRVESDRLDHLMNLAGELVITKARFVAIARGMDDLFRTSNARALTSDTHERLESISRGLEALTESKSSSCNNPLDRWSVHFRRLRDNFRAIQDELYLIREAREHLKSLTETIHSLGRVSDGLQKGVLDTRMVPIGPLFERFRRVIRDLSLSSGKEVTLQISGEKTELDKRMIDELSDPLIHMVRNAVDHGLESPAAARSYR